MEWNKNQILEAIKPNILERLNAPLTAIFCSPDELILEEKRNGGNWGSKRYFKFSKQIWCSA